MSGPNEKPVAGRTALVTGATGYIGSRLVPRLIDAGWHVTVLTRDAGKLDGRAWRHAVRVVEGDADDAADTSTGRRCSRRTSRRSG